MVIYTIGQWLSQAKDQIKVSLDGLGISQRKAEKIAQERRQKLKVTAASGKSKLRKSHSHRNAASKSSTPTSEPGVENEANKASTVPVKLLNHQEWLAANKQRGKNEVILEADSIQLGVTSDSAIPPATPPKTKAEKAAYKPAANKVIPVALTTPTVAVTTEKEEDGATQVISPVSSVVTEPTSSMASLLVVRQEEELPPTDKMPPSTGSVAIQPDMIDWLNEIHGQNQRTLIANQQILAETKEILAANRQILEENQKIQGALLAAQQEVGKLSDTVSGLREDAVEVREKVEKLEEGFVAQQRNLSEKIKELEALRENLVIESKNGETQQKLEQLRAQENRRYSNLVASYSERLRLADDQIRALKNELRLLEEQQLPLAPHTPAQPGSVVRSSPLFFQTGNTSPSLRKPGQPSLGTSKMEQSTTFEPSLDA